MGSEILDGRFEDAHFACARALLAEHGMALSYSLLLPDAPGVITSQLSWAMGRQEPFFCCGGIGSTPDDHTRECAARAAGVPIERHPEGVEILRSRMGKSVTEMRLRMVDFPEGATLIPNPVNRVPGFSIGNGYFLPGFPEMASPMMEWVLDTYYLANPRRLTRSLILPGCREADLVDLMKRFIAAHPDVSFSSLPRFTSTGTQVELGVTGVLEAVEVGIAELAGMLRKGAIDFHEGRNSS